MPIDFDIKDRDLEALQAALRRAGDDWPVMAREIVTEAVDLMQFVAHREAPINTGFLRNSIATAVTMEGADASARVKGEVFSDAIYAEVMESGRRPGARQPPTAAIKLWVRRKLGISGKDLDSVAYVIARSIKRKGIKGRQYFKQAAEAGERQFGAIVDRALDRWVRKLE